MKYYIISGESSGDMHGANLIRSLKAQDQQASFRFWGGDKMLRANGGKGLDQHIKETSFMGFTEVIANLGTIVQLFSKAKKQITQFEPDVIILIDYPGFNMRMAKWLKRLGFKVVYYIVPQVWAWKEKRAYSLQKYSDLILTILPFEKDWFQKKGIDVEYVGHPLLDGIKGYTKGDEALYQDTISLLPGSRKQEIQHILKPMLQACIQLPYKKINIAGVSSHPVAMYQEIINEVGVQEKKPEVIFNETYKVISESDVALVSSGTATLETAILGTPQVVCYVGDKISYMIAKKLVKLKYISLVNLIMDEPLVPELIQADCTPDNIVASVSKISRKKDTIRKGYHDLRLRLGGAGASDKAAALIISSCS